MLSRLTPYILVLPLISFIAVFTYIPIAASLNLSFREWDFLSPTMPLVGFENYRLLFSSHEFWNSLKVTAIFAVISVPIRLCLALVVASYLVRELCRPVFCAARCSCRLLRPPFPSRWCFPGCLRRTTA